MRTQALKFGATLQVGQVDGLVRLKDGFEARGDALTVRAPAVILATGVTNRRPAMDATLHDRALAGGQLRYCPVCDGFEVIDQSVAVIGTGAHGAREATFLRTYSDQVTLIAPEGPYALAPDLVERLQGLNVALIDGPVGGFALEEHRIILSHAAGRSAFDTIYPALGSQIHSDLARTLGAELTEEGCIRVDPHQRTSVAGLYAAGDVVLGLDQISHAMGEAGVAATTLRNDLAERSGRRL